MIVQPVSSLNGTLKVPGDKSISHRSIMFGALAKGSTHVTNFLTGADCLSTIACFKQMGITIEQYDTSVTIHGKGLYGLKKPAASLDVGNSGTTMRLMSGILAGQSFTTTVTGDASIKQRPMGRIITPLTQMGASIKSQNDNNLAPLMIHPKPLKGIAYTTPVASAQIKSCLLLASLYANSPTTITEPAPSRNHSEIMLSYFGVDLQTDSLTTTIQPGKELFAKDIVVPADISSAAFFLVAGLIVPNSQITLLDVGINPTRDGIIHVLKAMNGHIEITNQRVVNGEMIADLIVRSSSLIGTTVSGDLIPTLIDEIPVIAVAAAYAKGVTTIQDAEELKVKESNRIETMVNELRKMSVNITPTSDGMIIKGGTPLQGAKVKSYHDHRVAMALAIAGLQANGTTIIENSACIAISYPDFNLHLNQL